jgi:polar amino acid transport system substrate-binding protein
MQFLQQGKIDLMIATMNDKPDRRQIVGIVEPDYYASSVTIMAPKKLGLKKWEEIKGKPVCAIQGAWYNKPIQEQFGPELIAFKGLAEAQTALQQGNCIGLAYDDTSFAEPLSEPKWKDYELAVPSIMEDPWGLAVKLEEREGPWGKFMSEQVIKWHRTGRILELEKKWGIPPSPYAAKMHEQYKKTS